MQSCFKLQLLLNFVNTLTQTQQDNAIVCRYITEEGSEFVYFENTEEYLSAYNSLKEQDEPLTFQEVIFRKYRKFFIDIDLKNPTITYNEYMDSVNMVVDSINSFYSNEIYVVDSSNSEKFSTNLVLDGLYFTAYQSKCFLGDVLDDLKENWEVNPVFYEDGVIDRSVYKSNQMIRMLGCSKIGSERFKKCKTVDFLLIGDYTSEKDICTDYPEVAPKIEMNQVSEYNFNKENERELKIIYDKIKPMYFETFNSWWYLGLIAYRLGTSFEFYNSYSEKASNYDYEKTLKNWESYPSKTKYKVSIHSLKKYM
jgi:hypothetical protein